MFSTINLNEKNQVGKNGDTREIVFKIFPKSDFTLVAIIMSESGDVISIGGMYRILEAGFHVFFRIYLTLCQDQMALSGGYITFETGFNPCYQIGFVKPPLNLDMRFRWIHV